MILVDTSVWIDHLHQPEPVLIAALSGDSVLRHPLVIEELALGSIRHRDDFLALLSNLAAAPSLSHAEVMTLVNAHHLGGRGLGVVDAHLLGSIMLVPGAYLWTRDKRMKAAAVDLGAPIFDS